MKRTVEEPKKFVKPPMCSWPTVISGCRPFHTSEATTLPTESVMVVRRRLRGEVEMSSEDHELEKDSGFFGCESLQISTRSSTVEIAYARSPDATSTRAVFSRSAAVNLSNIWAQTWAWNCSGVHERDII